MCLAKPIDRGVQPPPSSPVSNRPPLQPNAFDPMPLGSVKPAGWLKRELVIQANGLSGHLDEVWPDVGPDSGWLGGKGESWERGPYYLDGLVPLAYLLGDSALIAKVNKRVNWVLAHQGADGWLGPDRKRDWWPNMVLLKALAQYQEATGDPRVIPAMQRYFHYQAAHLQKRPLRDWGKFRWADEVVSVLWLYNRTGDASLLDLARTLQAQGHDWKGEFAAFPFTSKTNKDELGLKDGANPEIAMSAHGVNNAMALKTSGVWWLVSGSSEDRAAAGRQLSELDRYHLLPNGGLLQFRDLAPQLPLGQAGQLGGTLSALDQGFEHRPARNAQNVTGHRGQLDVGVFQFLVNAVDRARFLFH
jgi:hypothetical protein